MAFPMMRKALAPFLLPLFLMLSIAPANAQPYYAPNGNQVPAEVAMCLNSSGLAVPCTDPTSVGIKVTGTFSASLSGFTPSASGARMTPLTVTTSDSSGALPTGAVVVVSNPGANPMYCNVNGVAATVADQPIAAGPGNWFPFTIPSGVTTLHCIATGGPTTANGVGGSGLPTGAGGGGGGGSSSNASVSSTGSAVPASATYVGIISGSNLVGWNGAITGTVTANQPTASAFNATVVFPSAQHTIVDNANANVGNNADAVAVGAAAGSPVVNYNYGFNGTTWDRLQVDGSKNLKVTSIITGTLPAFAATPTVIVSPQAAAARHFPGATVGTSSAQALAASTAANFLQIQNTSASASVACAFGVSAVLNSSTSVQLGAGQSASWGPNTGGVPTGALNCIASGASTPLYVEWN